MSRCVLYSKIKINNEVKIYVLLGKQALTNQLTTIGGRKISTRESDMDCVIREMREETKGIIDYTEITEYHSYNNRNKIYYSTSAYYFNQADHETLEHFCDLFDRTDSTDISSMELTSLVLLCIDDVLLDMNSESPQMIYNPNFRNMFLGVGYDYLKKNICNHNVTKLGIPIEFAKNITLSQIPEYISFHHTDHSYLPVIYGKTLDKEPLYISNQYYGFIRGKHVFRSN